MKPLHPAHRLCCWLLAVVAIQCLSGGPLLVMLIALPLLGRASLLRWLRLMRRARWLLLTLLVVVAWGVAGEPVWSYGAVPAPTWEGLAEAGNQLGRLSLVLAAVAALLETTPIEQLMSGAHVLLQPFRLIGLDVDRAVVRLSLALHYAEDMPVGDWKHLLTAADVVGPDTITLATPPSRPTDWLILFAALLLPIGACLA